MKLLTITVPSYNVEKTLSPTLDSLCIEDFIDKLDIIVIDDGSSDRTQEIAQGFALRYPDSVRVVRKANGGHGSTINKGIELAQGRYFKVVDGDDQLDRKGFSALVKLLESTDADLVAAHYQKVIVNSEEAPIPMRFEGVAFGKIYRFQELSLHGNIYFGIHSLTIKTSILKENNVRVQEHTFYVDVEYGLLPIPYVNTVEFLDETVYCYYIGNSGQSIDEDHYRVVKRMVSFACLCKADAPHLQYIGSVLRKLCFTHYMLAAFYDDDVKRGKSRAREFDAWLKENDSKLYQEMNRSMYIRMLRLIHFCLLPKGNMLKVPIQKVYKLLKPFLKKRQKMTY